LLCDTDAQWATRGHDTFLCRCGDEGKAKENLWVMCDVMHLLVRNQTAALQPAIIPGGEQWEAVGWDLFGKAQQ